MKGGLTSGLYCQLLSLVTSGLFWGKLSEFCVYPTYTVFQLQLESMSLFPFPKLVGH